MKLSDRWLATAGLAASRGERELERFDVFFADISSHGGRDSSHRNPVRPRRVVPGTAETFVDTAQLALRSGLGRIVCRDRRCRMVGVAIQSA
jgi:hypothetical protein